MKSLMFNRNLAVYISDKLFNHTLVIMMVIKVIFIIWKPEMRSSSINNGDYSMLRKGIKIHNTKGGLIVAIDI